MNLRPCKACGSGSVELIQLELPNFWIGLKDDNLIHQTSKVFQVFCKRCLSSTSFCSNVLVALNFWYRGKFMESFYKFDGKYMISSDFMYKFPFTFKLGEYENIEVVEKKKKFCLLLSRNQDVTELECTEVEKYRTILINIPLYKIPFKLKPEISEIVIEHTNSRSWEEYFGKLEKYKLAPIQDELEEFFDMTEIPIPAATYPFHSFIQTA